jgi:hypothetical protein
MKLNRDQTLEKLQIQGTSLMRLNAAWGLEPKAEPIETYKANPSERLKRQAPGHVGV